MKIKIAVNRTRKCKCLRNRERQIDTINKFEDCLKMNNVSKSQKNIILKVFISLFSGSPNFGLKNKIHDFKLKVIYDHDF